MCRCFFNLREMISKRPKVKPEINTGDRISEATAIAVLITHWIMVIVAFSNLPETIPIHFDAAGNPDGFGKKPAIFFLPIIATKLYAIMTILNLYPNAFNYPIPITEANAQRQYTHATRLLRRIKLAIVIVFFTITYFTVRSATGLSDGLGIWFLPFMLLLIFVPLAYYLVKAYRDK